MNQQGIASIEQKLNVKLPEFYVRAMLNYPFDPDSFTAEFSLCNNPDGIINFNQLFNQDKEKFVIGTDGGELVFYIKLNGDDRVYTYDFEASYKQDNVSWENYLAELHQSEKQMKEDEEAELERKLNKKWWQFWI